MGRRRWSQRHPLFSPLLGRLLFCGRDIAVCAGRSTPHGCAGCAGRWRGSAPAARCAGRLTPRSCRHGADAAGCARCLTLPPGEEGSQRCFLEGAGMGLTQPRLGRPAQARGRIRPLAAKPEGQRRQRTEGQRHGPALPAPAETAPWAGRPPLSPGGVGLRAGLRAGCGLGWALSTHARRQKELWEGQWTRLGLQSSYLFSHLCSLSLLSLSPSHPLLLARSLEYVCAQDWLSP